MGKDDEVIPDSQDEAEFHALESQPERDLSPPAQQLSLTNTTTPSLRTSSSYVLPRSIPAQPTMLSTISQFTTDPQPTNERAMPSAISAFASSSSSTTVKRSRPKPRPCFAGAVAARDASSSSVRDADVSIAPSLVSTTLPRAPTSGHTPHVLPPPQATFSSDISERIKARRATAPTSSEIRKMQDSNIVKTKGKGTLKKKPVPVVEDVINISSDTDTPNIPSRSASSSKNPKTPAQSPDPLDLSIATHVSPTIVIRREIEEDVRDRSLAPSRKRKHDLTSHLTASSGAMDATSAPKPADNPNSGLPPRKKKKKSKVTEETADKDASAPDKPKKKKAAKDKDQEPKKPRAKPKAKEKDQFKSSEFIADSDDELGLAGGDSANGAEKGLVSVPDNPDTIVVTSTSSLASSKASLDVEVETGHIIGAGPRSQPQVAKETTKTTAKKRKATSDDEASAAIENEPPAKAKRVKKNGSAKAIKEKTKLNQDGADVPAEEPVQERPKALDVDETLSVAKAKKKGCGRVTIDDEEDQGDLEAKENAAPIRPNVSTPNARIPAPEPPNKPPPSVTKPSYAHPPKNRPLSSILQRVNGASPRPRASPSVSRTLLTRIAPLHPNRRTPPPPPPPRIVPKKTKKELEREEKWEEELQEIEGWGALSEAERERMRRAKRDWELRLCEE